MNKASFLFLWICLVLFSGINLQTVAQKQSKFKIKESKSLMGQEYKSITFDGTWCWFSDPRAVHHDGKTFVGYVTSFGDIETKAGDWEVYSSGAFLLAGTEIYKMINN